MKQVVDSSFLRRGLREFLQAAKSNVAVVPDQLWMETFKGDGQTNLLRNLGPFADFPNQVWVLKSTHAIVPLRPKRTDLPAALIDDDQTEQFQQFCRALVAGSFSPDDRNVQQAKANLRYSRQLAAVEVIRTTIERYQKLLSHDDVKMLRAKRPVTPEFCQRFCDDVVNACAQFMLQDLKIEPPPFDELVCTYPFRYTLCAHARAIDWIMEGGFHQTPSTNLMNDYTDMAYAAYATYFDGLGSNDGKLREIYAFARMMLDRVFLAPTENGGKGSAVIC